MRNLIALILTLAISQILYAQKIDLELGSKEYQELKASGELMEGNYTIKQQDNSISDHVTVYPSRSTLRGGGGNDCDCWIEPDGTYTQAGFPTSFLVDDGSTNNLPFPFDFELYGNTYTSMWINTNGTVTFDAADGTFTPQGFPNDDVMLAPFWGDVDLSCGTCGEVFYKITDDAVYINWLDVGYFDEQTDKLNTFQVVFTASDAGILPGDNTVQFCYQDMQWTTGSASGGSNGFGGSPATVGANAGNSTDYIQFGQFDQEGDNYDGPFGQADGISWLDFQTITFNANISANDNLPPLAIGTTGCDSLVLCANDTEILEYTFLAPENGQDMTVTVNDDGFPNIDLDITSGSPADVTMTLTSGLDAGEYDIEIIVTDDGTPAASTSIVVHVEVIAIEVPDLEISSDGELIETISYCQGQGGALLSGSDGFDSYEWSDGNDAQSDDFTQGTYTLTAYFMGCDTEAGPVTVFQIPVFNPDVSIEDLFLCEGDVTDISIDNPEDYESVEWSVYNNDGEIVSTDLMADTITVQPGFYEVSVIDSNGCPGSRIVPVVEEVVEIPNTNFAPVCDGEEISWSGAWSDPETCAHFIYVTDSEGDTWEGANVEVYIDGTGPFNFNIATGAVFQPGGIEPYHGQVIEYFFTSGLDDDEIGVQIFDGNNTVVFDSNEPGDDLIEGLFFTQVANCGFNALPGQWVVDAPSGGEGWELEFSDVFNPVDGSNTFTAPPGVVGTYTLTFESDICSSDTSFPLEFSTAPTVVASDYDDCNEVSVEPEYGPDNFPTDVEYDWTPNLGCDGSPDCIFSSSTNYQITVSNSCGSNSSQGNVVIGESPTAALTDFTICDNQTQTLNPGNSASSATYFWDGPGVDGSTSESVTIDQGGEYTVEVTTECGTASATSIISQFFSPSVPFWAFDTLVCPGEVIDINPLWSGVDGPISWSMSWTDGDGNEQTMPFSETGEVLMFGSDQIPFDAENTNVHIEYSYSNSCGTASGQVTAYTDACFITATNVFSPDNDGADNGQFNGGLNEAWYIVGIESVANVEVRIFNRWGTLVYENDSYSNLDPWEGKDSADNELSEGVYYYTIKTPRGNQEIQGSVTILRD